MADAMLAEKVAIVTGAGHGIGRAHALELARHGAHVVVNDLGSSVTGEGTSPAADDTVELIRARGGEAIADYGNVADHAEAGELVAGALRRWGRLDVLVNNAGIVRDAAIWNMTPDDFDAVMAVHVRGSWSCSHHAAVHWRAEYKAGHRRGGRIINTTSGAGLLGNFGQSNYAPAKAAIVALTQTLAVELARFGVTVNTIGPSGATRITATMPGAPTVIEPGEDDSQDWEPMDPANSSPLVAWLASDEASMVSAQVIRSIHDRIIWMRGWTERSEVTANGRRWEAEELGQALAGPLFGIGPTVLNLS